MMRLIGVLFLAAGIGLIIWAFNFDVTINSSTGFVNIDAESLRAMIFDGGVGATVAGWLTIIVGYVFAELSPRKPAD